MGEVTSVKVEFFDVVKLQLFTGSFLELFNVVYLPSIRRNLISVSLLGKCGYNFLFGNDKVATYSDSLLIGNGIMCDNLYKVDLFHTSSIHSTSSLVNTVMGLKRSRLDKKSSMFWHRHLGHISKQRIESWFASQS